MQLIVHIDFKDLEALHRILDKFREFKNILGVNRVFIIDSKLEQLYDKKE